MHNRNRSGIELPAARLLALGSVILMGISLYIVPSNGWTETRVLWDASHTPLDRYTPAGEYLELSRMLEQSDYQITVQERMLARRALWEADILVISILSNYELAYTAAEIENILEFSRFGGIIILADNSAVRRRNLEGLLNGFGLRAAQDDLLGNLINLVNSPLFEGVDSVVFRFGSVVGSAPGGNNARILASDRTNRAGIVQFQPWGRVILIGDADVWTNSLIFEADNAQLALNCFDFVKFPPVESRLEVQGVGREIYLPQNRVFDFTYPIRCIGNNQLRFGCEITGGEWVSVAPAAGILAPNQGSLITIDISAYNLPVDTTVGAQVTVLHNTPGRQFPIYDILMHIVSPDPVHFEMPPPAVSDHSLLIQELRLEGEICPPGVEIAVFTPAGFCAGGAVHYGGRCGLAAGADDPFTQVVDGFQPGEIFEFRMFLPWSNAETAAQVYFIEGPQRFVRDGFTVLNLDARPAGELRLNLNARWNWISLNVAPPVLEFSVVLAEPIGAGQILLVKDGRGRFYDPRRGFNNIGLWDLRDGYAVMVAQPQTLTVRGVVADANIPLPLILGWNLIAYLPQQAQALQTAMEDLGDNLLMVKRDDGAFYTRQWNWDGVGTLEPGEGYLVKLAAPDTLIYPAGQDEAASVVRKPITFTPSPSGEDMSLLLIGLPPFCEVGLFDLNNISVGRGFTTSGGRLAIPVWGDNPATEEREGLQNGETFDVKLFKSDGWTKIDFICLEGEAKYETNGFIVGKIAASPASPSLLTAYPNPFNDVLIVSSVEYPQAGEICAFDISGRLIAQRSWSETEKIHQAQFSAADWPSGIIFLRWKSSGRSAMIKALHLP